MEGEVSRRAPGGIYHRSTRCLLPVSMLLHQPAEAAAAAATAVAEKRQMMNVSTAIVLF